MINMHVASNPWCLAVSFEWANMIHGGAFTVWYRTHPERITEEDGFERRSGSMGRAT
jgi:hypothetical protein